MDKRIFRKIVCDPYVIVSVCVGVVLMALTLYFRVNPAEGSVVDEAVRGTWFHYVLMVTTMPAYIAGLVLGPFLKVFIPIVFVVQIILYTVLGLLLRLIHRLVFPQSRKARFDDDRQDRG
jgi:hypothetical protein